jgi:hypothetical protein
LWGGKLTGRLPAHGNLVLIEKSNRTHTIKDVGFRLEGKFVWHLVRGENKRHHLVVVDTHGQGLVPLLSRSVGTLGSQTRDA